MRFLLLALATCLIAAQTPIPREPKAITEYLYAHPNQVYATRDEEALSARFFSARLRNLYMRDRKNTPEGDSPNLDFDFMSNSQDPEISQVSASATPIDSNHQTVTVHFLEMTEPQVLEYDFVCEKGAWRIDDVRCSMNSSRWTLTKILIGTPSRSASTP